MYLLDGHTIRIELQKGSLVYSEQRVSEYLAEWCWYRIMLFLTMFFQGVRFLHSLLLQSFLSGNFVYNANTILFTVLLRITCNPPSQDLWTQMNLKIWQLLYVLITESLCHTQLCTFKKEGKNVTFVAPRINKHRETLNKCKAWFHG